MDKSVYKVVAVKGRSLKSSNARFLEPAKEIILTYAKKKKTIPLIGGIFIFENLDDAKEWKNTLSCVDETIIIKGFARNIRKPSVEYVLGKYSFNSFDRITKYWNSSIKPYFSSKWDIPNKTLICDSFTMTEVVD